MLTIFVRTLLIYAFLLLALRIMGKRQIGELEVTDLITTLLISEIASLPITNQDIPVSYALIPIATLLILEVLFSMVLVKLPRLRGLVSAKPTVIIRHGLLCQRALLSLRISVEELMSEIRQRCDSGKEREADGHPEGGIRAAKSRSAGSKGSAGGADARGAVRRHI